MAKRLVSVSLALNVCLVAAAGVIAASPTEGGEDWIVTGEKLLIGETRFAGGSVLIESGATLHLKGSTLSVGKHLVVRENGTLVLEPFEGQPSRLLPADPAVGFWAQIAGTIRSHGTPATIIRGINGDGFSTFFEATGGLKISGLADLDDIDLSRSRAGLLVEDTGRANLRNATIHNFGFTGIMSEGRVSLQNVSLSGHGIGITGRGDACKLFVQDSRLSNFAANVQVTGCSATIRSSLLRNASKSIVMNGNSLLAVEHSLIQGYDTYGIVGHGGSRIEVKNSTLLAGSRGEDIDYQRGIELRSNNWLLVENSTIRGNYQDGINSQFSTVEIRNSSLESNRRHGIFLHGGGFQEDPVASNTYGSPDLGTLNQGGAISSTSVIRVRVLDRDNRSLAGLTIKIVKERTGEVVFEETESGSRTVTASFESWTTDAERQPRFLGPFVYTLSHPYMDEPVHGRINLNQEAIEFQISGESAFDFRNLAATTILVTLVGALLVAGYFSGALGRALAATQRKLVAIREPFEDAEGPSLGALDLPEAPPLGHDPLTAQPADEQHDGGGQLERD